MKTYISQRAVCPKFGLLEEKKKPDMKLKGLTNRGLPEIGICL